MQTVYTLLNKNTPVLDLEFKNQEYSVVYLTAVHNPEYAPLGVVKCCKEYFGIGFASLVAGEGSAMAA